VEKNRKICYHYMHVKQRTGPLSRAFFSAFIKLLDFLDKTLI